jgi:coatomer subunit beta
MSEDAPFLCPPKDNTSPKWDEIEESLRMRSNPKVQFSALRSLIQYQVTGENPPDSVLMTTIQHVSTSQDHATKKLLFLYYEMVETRDRKGNLKPEFLLICDALRNDLIHPNEYLRAAALRLASKFQEDELIGPLVSAIEQSLHHSSAYVRRHAVVALGRIYQRWPKLAPSAPSEIGSLLQNETDSACCRVAFLVLCDISRELAVGFLDDIVDKSVLDLPQPMQLTATALIKSLSTTQRKDTYLGALIELISSLSPAVQLEAGLTLLDITSTPTASQAGLAALTQIMLNVPNVSLQLSIADQLERLLPTHLGVCQSLAVEFLTVLKAKPIRGKILSIVEKLVTPGNAVDVVSSLVRYLTSAKSLRVKENEQSDALQFMGQLLRSLRVIAASQSTSLSTIYEGIFEYVTDSDASVSFDAIILVRDIVLSDSKLRERAIPELEKRLSLITSTRVARLALHLISLYSTSPTVIDTIISAFTAQSEPVSQPTAQTAVIGDGSYVQLSGQPIVDTCDSISSRISKEPLLVSSVAIALARLCCRLDNLNTDQAVDFVRKIAPPDRKESRIEFAIAVMQNPKNDTLRSSLVDSCETAFSDYVTTQRELITIKPVNATVQSSQGIGDRLNFRDLLGRGFNAPLRTVVPFESKRGELYQMTGTSDTIFCECRMVANMFDIALDFRLLNQTSSDLKNVRVELNCAGKLELIDRPAGVTLPAHTAEFVKFSVKVTSAEAGKVFGTITYEVNGLTSSDQHLLPLATITVSPASYMRAEPLDSLVFRRKWEDFEWEKKIQISTSGKSLSEFLNGLCQWGKMKVIVEADMSLPFLTTNLYSKSYFGEEVLANVNVELVDGKVTGFVRLRTDTQAMALAFSHLIQSIESCMISF